MVIVKDNTRYEQCEMCNGNDPQQLYIYQEENHQSIVRNANGVGRALVL
jgi:hypothetical protein